MWYLHLSLPFTVFQNQWKGLIINVASSVKNNVRIWQFKYYRVSQKVLDRNLVKNLSFKKSRKIRENLFSLVLSSAPIWRFFHKKIQNSNYDVLMFSLKCNLLGHPLCILTCIFLIIYTSKWTLICIRTVCCIYTIPHPVLMFLTRKL